MELVKVGAQTYYLKNPTNIGIYQIDENNVYLIDSGNDKDAGRKILKIVTENGWQVKGIINTHSHADHIGGNKMIQERTNCVILTSPIEKCFTEFPILEPSFLYGSFPFKELQNKFFLAEPSQVLPVAENLPEGLKYFSLKGHSGEMIGIKTSDDVYFLGDALINAETIQKYHLFYLYDVKEYLDTLDYLETLKGKLYIPSHGEATTDISSLITLNRTHIQAIAKKIYDFCRVEATFEEILSYLFQEYKLIMNANQYILIGSTVKAYLSYLNMENKLAYEFKDNKMWWKQVNNTSY